MGDLGEFWRDVKEESNKYRNKRDHKFRDEIILKLKDSSKITHVETSMDKVTVTTNTFGIIDIFPKADRFLIRKGNKWCSGATRWILNNLL